MIDPLVPLSKVKWAGSTRWSHMAFVQSRGRGAQHLVSGAATPSAGELLDRWVASLCASLKARAQKPRSNETLRPSPPGDAACLVGETGRRCAT